MKLDWYPKQFSVGDMHGIGTLKLLAGASVPNVAVLVRETAQNSWDAREPGQVPRMVYHAHEITGMNLELLRNSIFHEPGNGTGLEQLLLCDSIPVLEIADRGTHGLVGPTRNDLTIEAGVPTDWIDFVLTLGAPQDKANGGGTFGFGKVISYIASSVHTILIWTRVCIDGRLSSRLIASAIGSSFDREGRKYTGRQWWGRTLEDRIEPVEGEEADTIAHAFFAERFAEGETGTSILVLNPELGISDQNGVNGVVDHGLEELAKNCAISILWNLWPKLVADESGQASMDITVRLRNENVAIADPLSHPILKGFAQSLQQIRETQSCNVINERAMTSCQEITRYGSIVGHLAITRLPDFEDTPSGNPIIPINETASHVALMRNAAELVVTYEAMNPGHCSSMHLCGVFRPLKEHDGAFARSEPPAHDIWQPNGISDATEKSIVRVALRNMRQKWGELTSTKDQSSLDRSSGVSTAILSNELSDLVPGLTGSRAAAVELTDKKKRVRKKKKRSSKNVNNSNISNARNKRTSIRIKDYKIVAASVNERTALALVEIKGQARTISVLAELAAEYDGGSDAEIADQYIKGSCWYHGHLSEPPKRNNTRNDILRADEGESKWTFVVTFDHRITLSLDIRLVRGAS